MIDHRLEVCDAICEVLAGDGGEGDLGYDPDDVEAVVEALQRRDWDKANEVSPGLVEAVLVDCVAGSTYVAALGGAVECGEVSKADARRHYQVARRVGAKLTEVVGYRVRVPFA